MAGARERIALVTDSTSDLPAEIAQGNGILQVPLGITLGEQTFVDGVDITKEIFYERLGSDGVTATTSRPTPLDFLGAYRQAEAAGAREIVVVTLSAALSGTYESALAAAEQVQVPVRVMDSRSVSMGLGLQVLAAEAARRDGGDASDMIAAADRIRRRLRIFFAVKSLSYLHRGGRIGGGSRFLGDMLHLKPVLMLDGETGRVDAVERARTWKRAMKRIYELTTEGIEPGRRVGAWVMHAAAPDDAAALAERVTHEYAPATMGMGLLSVALGAHAGPGTVGMGMYLDDD